MAPRHHAIGTFICAVVALVLAGDLLRKSSPILSIQLVLDTSLFHRRGFDIPQISTPILPTANALGLTSAAGALASAATSAAGSLASAVQSAVTKATIAPSLSLDIGIDRAQLEVVTLGGSNTTHSFALLSPAVLMCTITQLLIVTICLSGAALQLWFKKYVAKYGGGRLSVLVLCFELCVAVISLATSILIIVAVHSLEELSHVKTQLLHMSLAEDAKTVQLSPAIMAAVTIVQSACIIGGISGCIRVEAESASHDLASEKTGTTGQHNTNE